MITIFNKWILQGSNPINNFWDNSVAPGLEATVLVFERKVAVVVTLLGRATSRSIMLDSSSIKSYSTTVIAQSSIQKGKP